MTSVPPTPPVLPRISDYLEFHAAHQPGADAVVHGTTRLNWAELADRVDAWTAALLAAGIAKGDRVAMLSTPRPEFWIVFLATVRIGAIWTGLNPRYTRAEMAYVLSDAEPALLVALNEHEGRDFRPDIAALAQDHPSIRQVVCFGPGAPAAGAASTADFLAAGAGTGAAILRAATLAVSGDDPALIVYTSGSTGRPKGAMIHHRGPCYCSHFQNRYWGARRDRTRVINFLPVNHLASVVDISCFVLVAGGTIVFMEQFDPAATLQAIEAERITVLGGVPTMHQLILSHPDVAAHDLSSLEVIAIGGAAPPEDLVRRMRAYASRVSVAYGSTETVGHVTFTPPGASDEQIGNAIGLPVPEYRMRLARADGTPVAPGEEGEIQIAGDFHFRAYFRRPEATAETFTPDGWLRTGDVALERPDGLWKMVGRLKEMYKSGGYNVYPREIEQCLEAHPLVEMAAVVGRPDPLYQEVGHAFCQSPAGSGLTAEMLDAHCRAHLANYKRPKGFTIRPALPLLPVGKLDKMRLRDEAKAMFEDG